MAFAAQLLLAEPEPAVALEQAAAFIGDEAHIGHDADRAVDREAALFPDQAERPRPAHPQRIHGCLPASRRGQRKPMGELGVFAVAHRFESRRDAAARRQPLVERQRELGAARKGRRARRKHHFERFADPDLQRELGVERELARRRAGQRIEEQPHGDERNPAERDEPQVGAQQAERQRHGGAEQQQIDRAPRRVDHRGTSTRSSSAATTCSTPRPSISAAADRITRWRNTPPASRCTSSGIT